MQLLAGWMAERLNVHRVLAAGLGLWALATAASGFAGSFAPLLALRLLLGVGESVVYPSQCKLLGLRAREHQRGKANGATSAGQALGPAFGTLGGGLLMAEFGWRAVMIGFGLLSLLWLWPWLAATRNSPSTVGEAGAGRPPSFAMILRRRTFWSSCLGQFCNNYALYFVLSWLPLFLVKSRGFSVPQMSKIGAAVYLLYAASAALTGWASDRLIMAGQTPNFARKFFIVSSCLGTAACLILTINAAPAATVLWLLVTGIFFGLGTPMLFAITQTLAGPRAAGQWMGMQNLCGNLAGILGPPLTGLLIDETGSFGSAFALAGVISLIGALAYGFAIPRIECVEWAEPPARVALR